VDQQATARYIEMMITKEVATAADLSNLGTIYLSDDPKLHNFDRALSLLKQAADEQDSDAAKTLGDIYWQGLSGPQNPQVRHRYYRQAATLGSVEAMDMLASLFQCGHVVAQSSPAAEHWVASEAFAGSTSALRGYADKGAASDDPE